jgi:hypothetical protein
MKETAICLQYCLRTCKAMKVFIVVVRIELWNPFNFFFQNTLFVHIMVVEYVV